MDTFVDWLGNEIRAGDMVVFGTRDGNSGGIRLAKVTKVEPVPRWNWYTFEVTVQSAIGEKYPTPHARWGKATKPSTDRMLKYHMSVEDVEAILGIEG